MDHPNTQRNIIGCKHVTRSLIGPRHHEWHGSTQNEGSWQPEISLISLYKTSPRADSFPKISKSKNELQSIFLHFLHSLLSTLSTSRDSFSAALAPWLAPGELKGLWSYWQSFSSVMFSPSDALDLAYYCFFSWSRCLDLCAVLRDCNFEVLSMIAFLLDCNGWCLL